MNGSILEVVIVGAGQAGLSASYYLKHLGLEHVIFERGRVGDTWRSQRWDNFTMNTSNRLNALPGSNRKINHPESFYHAKEYIAVLEDYASVFQLPVTENATVLSIDKPEGSPFFVVTVSHDNDGIRKHHCWQVIIASGGLNESKIPAFAPAIAPGVKQIHSSQYRNASTLTEGSVLVVGSAQSGSQIAEDLVDAGREVYLATSTVPRMPRRYRGKDIMDWLIDCKFLDNRLGPEVAVLKSAFPGEIGQTTSLQYLALKGVRLLGKMETAAGELVIFNNDVKAHLKYGDESSDRVKAMIDEYIQKNQITVGEEEIDEIDISSESIDANAATSLNLKDSNIRTIIWATGLKGNFSYIKLPVLDGDGQPNHQQGVTSVEGLYFLGNTWLRNRKSGFIFGIKDDAGLVTNRVYSALR